VKPWFALVLLAAPAFAQDASVASTPAVSSLPANAPIASANLLSVARVTKADGVQRVEVITDGQAATDGEVWNSPMAAIIPTKGDVEWDLGQEVPIDAALVQADNNDQYLVWGSPDGTQWSLIWRAGPYSNDGLRTRTQGNLGAHARFVKLTGEGGDSMYSVGELQLYASSSTLTSPPLARKAPPPPPPPQFNPSWLVLAVISVGLFMFFTRRRGSVEAPQPPAAPEK